MKNLDLVIESAKKCGKGQFLSIVMEKGTSDVDNDQKVKSPYRGRITKRTVFSSVRFCDYENMQKTIEKREQGIEAVSPTWWHWVDFPFVAANNKTNELYIVVKATNVVPKSEYFCDGCPISYADIAPYMLKKSKSEMSVFMLKANDITEIRQGDVVFKV